MNVEDQEKVLAAVAPKGADKVDDEPEEGSFETLDENDDGIVDTDDGGAMVTLDEEGPVEGDREHFANLAKSLPDDQLRSLAVDLIDLIEKDIKARKKRDEQYTEGLRRTGLGDDAPGGAEFEGASRVVHPMLTKACVDFSARVMKELYPPEGPVKQYIPGTPTKAKAEKAQRKTKHMNWQLTKQMREFRSELEQVLTQVPLGGAQYLKIYRDDRRRRLVPEAVFIDDVIMPFAASNFLTAERRTHRQFLTEKKYQDRIKSGLYRDVDVITPQFPERSDSAEAADKIEGREADPYNDDGLRTVYETTVFLDIEEEDDYAPYIVTIDQSTQQILAIYRNWLEDDQNREELAHMVEFPFIPWRGAYPLGLIHMIGGLSAAATGALRALLDSAHIANSPSAVKLAGGSKGGQSLMPGQGEILELDGSIGQNDIRQVIMPMPFTPPSPVLFQLLGFLVEAGDNVVQTTFADMAKQNNNMPVGTTLALIEQGMTVFSSIHARMHAAMAQVLDIVHRYNRLYLEEKEVVDDTGELMVRRNDYDGPMDVIPVSDPNIFSEAQRFAQIQIIAQRAQNNPLYDQRKVEELILARTRLPDAKDLLVPQPQPQHLNAVNENAAACMGKPVVAFPEQDHLAHLAAHLGFIRFMLSTPGMNQLIGKAAVPILLTHLKEHISFWYVTKVYEMTSAAAGIEIDQLIDIKDEQVTQEFDRLMAVASEQALSQAPGSFGNAPTIIQQAIQFVQQMQQPPAMDPSAVAAQDVQRKAAADQQTAQIKTQELQVRQQEAQVEAARAHQEAQNDQQRLTQDAALAQQEAQSRADQMAMREQAESARKTADIGARMEMNREDNATAMQISAAEIATGERTNLRTGTGINPAP